MLIVPPAALLAAEVKVPEPPPRHAPVMFTVPVEELFTAGAVPPVPPVQVPVMLAIPVEVLFTAAASFPPKQFPVMVNVPVPRLLQAMRENAVPPVMLPIMVAEFVEANSTQFVEFVALLFVTFAVSVTPLLRTNFPVPALETSSQVVLTLMVIVWPVLARASSPTVGTTPPVHVAPALKFPVAAEVMRAMA
jgi:hypothetical protein